jgi:hypothetical protein
MEIYTCYIFIAVPWCYIPRISFFSTHKPVTHSFDETVCCLLSLVSSLLAFLVLYAVLYNCVCRWGLCWVSDMMIMNSEWIRNIKMDIHGLFQDMILSFICIEKPIKNLFWWPRFKSTTSHILVYSTTTTPICPVWKKVYFILVAYSVEVHTGCTQIPIVGVTKGGILWFTKIGNQIGCQHCWYPGWGTGYQYCGFL